MNDDVATTTRKKFTPTQRLKLFEAAGGICCICGGKIQAGDKWIIEHIRPLGLGGTNQESNLGPAHIACAGEKTHGRNGDAAKIAKAKRVKMRHIGISRAKQKIPSRPFPGSGVERRRDKGDISKIVARRMMFED